jgi:CheY-like chemotaxis protein
VSDMQEMIHRSIGPSIEIIIDVPLDLAPVNVDPNQLELALLNLVLNARDAMPEGGRLTIAARSGAARGHNILNLAPNDFICIAVSDTGIGMDETTLQRAAEPFFTTKDLGKGTGLGLSTVYGMTKQSGGATRISSKPGAGTTVELWLPIACIAKADTVTPIVASDASPSRPCCILLVEDDSLVAEGTAAMLEHLGHRVIVAASGNHALELLSEHSSLDLVITDHAMPGMTGIQLVQHIREKKPHLPVVLATGYTDTGNTDGYDIPRIDKPYRLDALASVIGSLQDTRPIFPVVGR